VFHTSPVHHVRCQDPGNMGWAWVGYDVGGMTIDQQVKFYWVANPSSDIYPETDGSGNTIMHQGSGGVFPYPRRGADHGYILYRSEEAGRAAIAKELEYARGLNMDLYFFIQNLHARWGDGGNNPWTYYSNVIRSAKARGATAPVATASTPTSAQCEQAASTSPRPSWSGAPKLDAIMSDATNREAVITAFGQQEGFYSAVVGHQCAFNGEIGQLVPNKEGNTPRMPEPCNKILNLDDIVRYLYYFT